MEGSLFCLSRRCNYFFPRPGFPPGLLEVVMVEAGGIGIFRSRMAIAPIVFLRVSTGVAHRRPSQGRANWSEGSNIF
jgi:hypothetical protein